MKIKALGQVVFLLFLLTYSPTLSEYSETNICFMNYIINMGPKRKFRIIPKSQVLNHFYIHTYSLSHTYILTFKYLHRQLTQLIL